MMRLARDQLNNKSRRVMPALMACVIPHEGEFLRPLAIVSTIETLTQHYRNLIKTKPHVFETGEKLGKKTSSFITSLEDALMCECEWLRESSGMRRKTESNVFPCGEFSGTTSPTDSHTHYTSTKTERHDFRYRSAKHCDSREQCQAAILSPLAAPFSPMAAPQPICLK